MFSECIIYSARYQLKYCVLNYNVSLRFFFGGGVAILNPIILFRISIFSYTVLLMFYRQDSENEDSSSTVSQTSYDPSQPMFKNMHSEIPDSMPEVVEIPSTGSAGKSKGKRCVPVSGVSNTALCCVVLHIMHLGLV